MTLQDLHILENSGSQVVDWNAIIQSDCRILWSSLSQEESVLHGGTNQSPAMLKLA